MCFVWFSESPMLYEARKRKKKKRKHKIPGTWVIFSYPPSQKVTVFTYKVKSLGEKRIKGQDTSWSGRERKAKIISTIQFSQENSLQNQLLGVCVWVGCG